MKEIRVRGICLQPGRPKVAVPVMGQSPVDIIEECEALKDMPCDMIEWRADRYLSSVRDIDEYLRDKNGYLDLVKILDDMNYIAGDKPIIFTIRSSLQGGHILLEKEQLESIYGLAAETGLVDIIDIELVDANGRIDVKWIKDRIKEAHENGVKVMLSHHETEKMPEPAVSVNIVRKMAELGADIFKLAAAASEKKEAENILKAAAFLTKKDVGPIVMIAMGTAGTASRVAAGKYGSCITFAAGKAASAPGQADVYTMKRWLDSYYGQQ